ncbi:hypothetical protein D3C87_1014030 [compost metagenome]
MPLPETELIKQIYEMVDGKGESQQEVLLLYFDKHYSIKDIHNITGQKYKTVEQIVVRFKKEVKEKYA